MDIQADVNKIRQAMKLLWEVANDVESNVALNAVVKETENKEALCPDPFVLTSINAWRFDFSEDHGFSCGYEPTDITADGDFSMFDWETDVELDRIVSFNDPPKEKAPSTDQSKTGPLENHHSILYAEMEDISSDL